MYNGFFKPIGDFILALVLLVVLSPVFVLTIILLYFFNKKNVFFTQDRPGKDERVFKIIKFKTMTDERDSNGQLLPDEDRLTKLGSLVRKTSLDELPQLINVLKGDMSFVGPRPLLVSYLPLYNSEQKKRHLLKPGITGLAQVNGRNAISWQKKFEYDVYYAKHVSFWLDVKIFLLTIKKVLIREGINTEGQATATDFKGNDRLSIIGAGGHAKVVIEIAEKLDYPIDVFDENINIKTVLNYPVNHDMTLLGDTLFFAIGHNENRKVNYEKYSKHTFKNIIHPNTIISKSCEFGVGNVIMANAVINASVTIGNHCIINTSTSIDHDCIIEDFVHVSPRAVLAGNVYVGEGTQIGMGSCIKQNIKIGKNCIIGMGAVVINDVPDYSVVVGNPAKIMDKNIKQRINM